MLIEAMKKQKRMTQTELAIAVGVTQPSISDYESGKKRPTIDTAKKLADALGCTVDDLLKDAKAV